MRSNTIYIALASLLPLLFFSCREASTDRTGTQKPGQEKTEAFTGLPYPVYESFAALQPLFQQENDTVYVINFWATWCKPCVEELPYFERLHEEMAGQKVKVILVSLDFRKDITGKLLAFVQERKLKTSVVALTDPRQAEWIDRVDPRWSGAIPATLIYRSGTRSFYENPFPSYEALQEQVSTFM